MRRCLLAALLAVVLGATARARAGEPTPTPAPPAAGAPAPSPPPAPDPLSIYVVTFGPGDHPFFKFGHDALLVRDRATGRDLVYNFGTFRFAPGLIGDFMKGRLTYWLSVSSLPVVMASYERENRTIVLQELALPAEAKRALVARLEENARPDRREYKYDYFLDNCATRVRDAVDRATGGALHAASRAPGRLTLREQALRMTADAVPLYLALDLVLAGATDRPIDRWAEMYIPEELERGLRAVTVPGPAGPRPLVASEQTAFTAARPPPLERPPARLVPFLLVGVGIGLVFVALGWAAPHRPLVRALLGIVVAAWGLLVGFIGCFLVYAWTMTDHVVAHRNENIFLCAPWAVSLLVLGVGVALGWRGATRNALRVAVAALLFALLGWGLKAVPAFHQHNAELIALLLPPWFGVSIGLLHARHGS
ncbi:MAG TPA: DUF4105 domain-containing protein [Polyangia bacterium]|nr:DUF4105 domain-containing protein [Polyangia bacterium]